MIQRHLRPVCTFLGHSFRSTTALPSHGGTRRTPLLKEAPMIHRPWFRASACLIALVIANSPAFAAGRRVGPAATPGLWEEVLTLASRLLSEAPGAWGISLKVGPGTPPAPPGQPSAPSVTSGDTDRGAGMDPWG